jgi:multiple sugar transport system ATP-binding protein
MSIEVRGLSKRFGGYVAVQQLDIEIADGEFFVLLGPSGCGKSTTLRMIAGLDTPSSGSVRIRGRDVTFAEPRHRDIAMVFQDYGLYPNMTVFQNIEFPLKVRKLPVPERRRKVQDTAERLGIAELLGRKPGKISGGQRQRVSLARALVRSPHAFLMDEPLSNLDASLRASMRAEIKQLVSALGITTVYVTHDQIEAMSMADRIGVMSGGEMIQVGRPLQVYDNPRTRFVAEFLGSPPMNLFPAELGGDGRVVAQPQSFADLLPAEQRELAVDLAARGRGFFVGVRPEHLSLVDRHVPHAVSAEVEFVEPLGQTTSLHLQSGSTQFLLITGRTSVTAGEKVAVIAAADHVRVIEASKSARDKG